MGKFLFGIFVGAILVGLWVWNVCGYGIGTINNYKVDCQKSESQECIMVFDFVAVETESEI